MRIRLILILFPVFLSNIHFAQIDQSFFLIGRTNGYQTFHDGAETRVYGFVESLFDNSKIPSPILYMNEGDSVEIEFLNLSQGAPHTIHWHGLDVDQQNDGVPHLSFEVDHSESGFYRFKVPHAGTYLYHCHVVSTIHVQAGMYGVVVVRPPDGDQFSTWENGEQFDRDFVWLASEIDTNWHDNSVLNHEYNTGNPIMIPSEYTPQYFMLNGLTGTDLTGPSGYYTAGENEKVFLRLANIGYQGVRFIFPSSLSARTISSDGRPLPSEMASDTVEILPGERYGTMIQIGTDPSYIVNMEHFNLNTQNVTSSEPITIQTSSLGFSTSAIVSPINVYPNPSKDGVFYVDQLVNSYTLTDLSGKTISHKLESGILDLSHNSPGIYILRIMDQTFKLVVR
jgi:FtsP/CotA-like multicopper oxidase with cupredoxin domain